MGVAFARCQTRATDSLNVNNRCDTQDDLVQNSVNCSHPEQHIRANVAFKQTLG